MCVKGESGISYGSGVSGTQTNSAGEGFTVKPIGYVNSNYHNYDDVPHRHDKKGWTDETSQIILIPEHAGKLQGLEGFSHIIVIFWVHKAKDWKRPEHHHNHKPEWVKLFATRMPKRPNPIGVSVVELSNFSAETGEMDVKGLDCLNETPVLDIKPYIPDFDSFQDATLPDWVAKHLREHHHSEEPS